jgi:hypothetical protein
MKIWVYDRARQAGPPQVSEIYPAMAHSANGAVSRFSQNYSTDGRLHRDNKYD